MKAVGYACDVCKTFATSTKNDRPPNGWMGLTVFTAEHSSMDTFHICSNRCLANIGKLRYRAERDGEVVSQPQQTPQNGGSVPVVSSGRREPTPEARKQFRQNGLSLQHNKGNHEQTPNPECLECQAKFGESEEGLRELIKE